MSDYLYRIGAVVAPFVGVIASLATMNTQYLGAGFVVSVLFAICDGIQHG